MTKIVAFSVALGLLSTGVYASDRETEGEIIPLYSNGEVPALGVPEIREMQADTGDVLLRNVSNPTLELFRPDKSRATGTAVVIAPGGGFVGLGYVSEGTAVAQALADRGVTALVLKYRTIESPTDPSVLPDTHLKEMNAIMERAKTGLPVEVPRFAGEKNAVDDGVRAMKLVRQHARDWGIDPHRVGVIGFSAGAFLAADLAIGEKEARPDFVGLLYGGLRTPVPATASPAFIAAAADDEYMPDDSIKLYSAWHQAGAAAELHVYEHGKHGFGFTHHGTTSDHWFEELSWWMQSRGLMGKPEAASK